MIFRFYRHVSLLPGAGPLEDALRLEDALEAGPELRRRARASREPNHELTFAPDRSAVCALRNPCLASRPSSSSKRSRPKSSSPNLTIVYM